MLVQKKVVLEIAVIDSLYLYLARNGATFGEFGEEGREVITSIKYVRGKPEDEASRLEFAALRKALKVKHDKLELIYSEGTFNWLKEFKPKEYEWQQASNRVSELTAQEMDAPLTHEEEMELRDMIVKSNQLAREIGFDWAVEEEWWHDER